MPKFKEKPRTKEGRTNRSPMLSTRQAAKLLKDRYVQQLEQKRTDQETETTYAVDRVEEAGRFAVEETTDRLPSRSPRQQERPVKERPRHGTGQTGHTPNTPESPDPPRGTQSGTTAVPKERRVEFKTRQAAEARYAPNSPQHHRTSLEHPSIESIYPTGQRAPERAAGRTGRSTAPTTARPPQQPPTGNRPSPQASGRQVSSRAGRVPGKDTARSVPARGRGVQNLKERHIAKAPAIKRREAFYSKTAIRPKAGAKPLKTASKPMQAARQAAQRKMAQRAAQQAVKAVRRGAVILRRVVLAVVKAVSSMVSALAGLLGGSVLLILLIAVIIVAAIVSSPLGIFFTEEPSSPDTVSVSQAISMVNMDYNSKLEGLQAGTYDDVVIHGQAPDWGEVLAVFAVKTAGSDQGVDVVTLDQDRVDRLTEVFWDMTSLSSEEKTVEHPATGDTAAWTETVLHITITAKTADEMRIAYAFTADQNNALDALLADRAALSSLAGSLSITDADARSVLNALPDSLSPERRAVVETALTLYGKVNYFWGGKSLTIGWNSRWGTLQKVTAAGSSTTGTYRPYGLDCSGFVDWVFFNISGGEYIIGHGGGAHAQHTYCTAISWDEAQPGDLVFYPDDEHVGIVCGRDEGGNLLVVHCASSANNVVITGISGFTSVARPDYYGT